ncbi:diguanylate cyclase [bacterium]|nr:diguanylate cyclase [bacterium]
MNFFDKLREYGKTISDIENSVYGNKKDYLEIYERNLELEKEIAQRTRELNIANKRMLTLQHIWEMMNSARPLESVLETIVNSLQGELGYLHSTILRVQDDEQGKFMAVIAEADNSVIKRVNNIIHIPMQMRRLKYSEDSAYAKALNERRIIQVKDISVALKNIIPDMDDETFKKVMAGMRSKAIIMIPLYSRNKPFGLFCVFSSREELADSELDFLTIFAQQIEMAITIAALFQEVRDQAITDGLTGLYNRRYFEEYISKEVTRSIRQNQPFSVVGIDLDFLKKINDEYGHAYGDLAIKTVADVLKSNARSIDIPARMGGEEFNVLLPGIDSNGAMTAAERIRKAIESQELEVIGNITASIGVATFMEHSDSLDELLELTDQAMYQSKRNGRNQVTMAKPIAETSWQEVAVNTFLDILTKHNVPIENSLLDDLKGKLTSVKEQTELPKEVLYSVADMLTKTYNPLHEQGAVKSKVLLASSLAKRFDLPKEEIDKLRIAVLLYDIGNLMLPKEILQKATPLTEEERSFIKEHPLIAARDILKPISYIQDIIPIVEHHHENWDGSGYPMNLSKDEIPITSQIILIVDAYFALTEHRPYRAKLSPLEALIEIKKETGKKWSEALVQEFVTLIEHDIK